MFHKPSSPGMVIIEVDCEFKRFNDLLGKHTWSKMLVNPDSDEEDKSSEVFYCNLETGRDVERKGWKRIWVEEHWFSGWRPDNT
ncbi:hypothetical protein BGW80DRAFT_1224213 [Lactifluus volemus]|nr:hypothetical protein BGW80DRAFT_1224213 [Lactifluus volemus]